MISNHARVGRALYLLKIDLDNFIPREFLAHHDADAPEALQEILGQERDPQRPFQSMKIQDLLSVMQASWWDVFDRPLGGIEPAIVREVALAHDSWVSRQPIGAEPAYQALTAIQRLLAAMSSPSTLELEMLKVESLESELESGAAVDSPTTPATDGGAREITEVVPEIPPTPVAAAEPPAVVVAPDPEPAVPEAAVEPGPVAESINGSAHGSATEPYLEELLRALREAGALREDDYLASATQGRVEPELADDTVFQELSPVVALALANLGFEGLRVDQAESSRAFLAGANLALETGWGDDPALAIFIPLAECLLRDPGGNALILCPDDATTAGLSARLGQLLAPLGLEVATSPAGLSSQPEQPEDSADSEDSEEPQRVVRQAILVTTMEQLNGSLLADRQDYQDYLANLKLVTLAEGQAYLGYFGANVAILLRRLAHLLSILGARPQYLLVAAGCANGRELAENLTGKDFLAVSSAYGPAAPRHYIFVDSPAPDSRFPVEFVDRIGRAALACLEREKSAIVYCASEELAGRCYRAAVHLAGERGMAAAALGRPENEPAVFTIGEIAGDSTGNTAGNAAGNTGDGTDAGTYDGVILAGFPDTVREAMQRIGRVGKADGRETFVLYYALNDPESRFYAHNPAALLAKGPDQLVADPGNQPVIQTHLPALLQESGRRIYSFTLDTMGTAVFQEMRRASGRAAKASDTPQNDIDLAGVGRGEWQLLLGDAPIGVISDYRRFREAYPGAALQRPGGKYRVTGYESSQESAGTQVVALDDSADLSRIRTEPTFSRAVAIEDDSLSLSLAGGVSLHLGTAKVAEQLTKVDVIEENPEAVEGGDETTGAGAGVGTVIESYTPEADASWEVTAQAFWIDVAGLSRVDDKGQQGLWDEGEAAARSALEQMFRVGARLHFPVDAYAIVTHCDAGKVFMVETEPGGFGIVKKVFDCWRDLLESGARLARQCPCDSGCANCLARSATQAGSLDKAGGLELAERLLATTGAA